MRDFVANLNGGNVYFNAVDKVFGVTGFGYFGGPKWADEWAKKRGDLRLEIEKIAVFDLMAKSAQARVDYFWRSENPRFRSQSISETLTVMTGTPPGEGAKPRWQIVGRHAPQTREEATMTYSPAPPVDEKGAVIVPDNAMVLGESAFEIAFPGRARAQRKQWQSPENGEKSLLNLRELGGAVLQFSQDYDEKLAFAPEFFRDALVPYTKNPAIFTIPASGELYTFNVNLVDTKPMRLAKAAQTVLFYEGQNQTPTFRYGTRAAILFADGHAALLSYPETKNLLWKP